VINDCSNSDPLLQPRSLGNAKRRTRVRLSLPFCSDTRQELSWNSTQIAEDSEHGRISLGLSEQRVQVKGSRLLLNPNSLMSRQFLIGFLVLRADNVPSIKKFLFLKKRKLFVTVSNPETMAKTADVWVEGQMANWNQILDPL
jgi:hypothetical protein